MEAILSWCQTAIAGVDASASLPFSLFLIAFFGGFAHCSFMCGPFVLMQQMKRMEGTPAYEMSEFKRLQGVMLLPYHFGRITTYCLLGVASYFLGQFLSQSYTSFMGVALIVAGVLFVLSILKIKLPVLSAGGDVLSSVSKKFSLNPVGVSGYFYGVVLGFLPCGMVYAALAASAGAESLFVSFSSMLAFGLGTVPSLFVVGFLSQFGGEVAKSWTRHIAKVGMLFAALWLIVMGLKKLALF